MHLTVMVQYLSLAAAGSGDVATMLNRSNTYIVHDPQYSGDFQGFENDQGLLGKHFGLCGQFGEVFFAAQGLAVL